MALAQRRLYKHGHMSNTLCLSSEPTQPTPIRYGQAHTVRPLYPILLGLVIAVGLASLAAWYYGDFSLEERAARGEAKAQYLMGKRYFDTATSSRDHAHAARLIRMAAQQGYAKAQAALGLLYENGLGVPKNYNEALKWLRLAADQGFAVAQNELGVMYAKGRGVNRSLAEASKWCKLAAAQGSEIARRNLVLAEVTNAKVIPQLTTGNKRTYDRVLLQKVESDGVTVTFVPGRGGLGVAKLKLDNLPSELQQVCKYATREGQAPDSAYSQIGSVATTL